MGRALVEAWQRYWFAPVAPEDLCLGRIAAFSLLFLLRYQTDFAAWAEAPRELWRPIAPFAWLGLGVLPAGMLTVLGVTWKASLLFAAAGLFTRISTATAGVLGAYLLALRRNFGVAFHSDAILILLMGVLAVSRCGDAWSLDRLRRRRRGRPPPAPSGEYRWPVRTVWLLFALVFFAAGVAKLRLTGLSWVTETFPTILLDQWYTGSARTDWGLVGVRHPWVGYALGATALGFELAFPLALVSRRARCVLFPGTLFMLVGIAALVGPDFRDFTVAYAFCVPWSAIVGRLRARRTRQVPTGATA